MSYYTKRSGDLPERCRVPTHVNRVYVAPWTCPTCGKVHNEVNEAVISYDGKNFDCSRCFRIYERAKHAEDLKGD